MSEKLSQHKVSKMMKLHMEGYSQTDIAKRLAVDQSTVSLYVSKLGAVASTQGLELSAKRYGIEDIIGPLHSLSVELRRANLTIEEATAAARVHRLLQRCGIKEEDYEGVIDACSKMHSQGFLISAAELGRVATLTGLGYEEIAHQCQEKEQELAKARSNLREVTDQIKAGQESLADISRKRRVATEEFATLVQRLGLDTNRLLAVEILASLLKEAGIGGGELVKYIENQLALNQAGISISLLIEILEQVRVVTARDQGQALLQMLSQYGNLSAVIRRLRGRVGELERTVSDLEEKQKLKARAEGDLAKLRADEATLKQAARHLSGEREALIKVQAEVAQLEGGKVSLGQLLTKMEEHKRDLSGHIKALENKLSNLGEVEVRHDRASKELAEMETKTASHQAELEVLRAFVRFIEPSSLAEIDQFGKMMPGLIALAKEKGYSPQFMRDFVLQTMTGKTLRIDKCQVCNATFTVDKPPASLHSHRCPACSSSLVDAVKDEADIIKAALAGQPDKEPSAGKAAEPFGTSLPERHVRCVRPVLKSNHGQ